MTPDEARARLLSLVQPGDYIHTILRHTSRSGMMRRIDLVHVSDTLPHHIGFEAGKLLGMRVDDGAVKITGTGIMDMGFALVYDLSRTLYPDGFECIGKDAQCPSNDHSNGDRNYAKHNHKDGGYALRQRWL